MQFSSPFSGISLLAHLGIIAISGILSALGIKRLHSAKKGINSRAMQAAKAVTSHLIVFIVFSIMFASLFMTVRSGVKMGAKEPHIKFVKQEIRDIAGLSWKDYFGLAAAEEMNQKWMEELSERLASN